jgi:hypothetical protein
VELQCDLVGGIIQARVADVESLHECLRAIRLIPDVDADEPDMLGCQLPSQLPQRRSLGAAWRAPRPPEIQDDSVTAIGRQAKPLPADRGTGHSGRARPVSRLVERGLVAVADEALPAAAGIVAADVAAVTAGRPRCHKRDRGCGQ